MAEPATAADVAKLTAELDRLCRHVEALQRDVHVLAGRIVPFENEELSKPGEYVWSGDSYERMVNRKLRVSDIADIVRRADRRLQGAEQDVRIIASKLHEISDDTYLKADMKEWIRDANGSDIRKR